MIDQMDNQAVSTAAAQLKTVLIGRGMTIAVAESLTAGHLQAAVAAVSGASDYFSGGLTAYNLEQKIRWLNVEPVHAEKVNCVSPDVALEMAIGIRKMFGSDVGVSTTGYAEADRVAGILSPFAYFAISTADNKFADKIVFPASSPDLQLDRTGFQQFVALSVLRAVTEWLVSIK